MLLSSRWDLQSYLAYQFLDGRPISSDCLGCCYEGLEGQIGVPKKSVLVWFINVCTEHAAGWGSICTLCCFAMSIMAHSPWPMTLNIPI